MHGSAADGKPLEAALIDEPARRQLGLPFCRRVAGHLRVLLFQGLGQGGRHHRVLKKLPALPSTAGSGSLAMRVAQTVSKMACGGGIPSAASGP
jgi:hypothetical protein